MTSILSDIFSPTSLQTIGAILAVMAVLAIVETAIPLHARGKGNRAHLAPNLFLTFLTFATNIVLNAGLVGGLIWLEAKGGGLLNWYALSPLTEVIVVLLVLDFSFYVAHVAMHKVPAFWRYHQVHHSDPAVDVTTTIRQHPGESLIRYGFLAAFAFALGASPAAFAVYRSWSAINGLIEHSNIRVPQWLDTTLALVTTFPNMHKVHHSRNPSETDSNYSNIFSIWDRLFLTYTPSRRGANIDYGLEGRDARRDQTTWGLLAQPYRYRQGRPAPQDLTAEGNARP